MDASPESVSRVRISRPAKAAPATDFVPTLLSVAKQTRAIFGLKLSAAGFHNGQDQMLLALQPGCPSTVSHLADTLGVRPSTVSKMLDRLIEKGFLERFADTRDARKTLVRITPAGVAAQRRIQKVWDAIAEDLTLSIGEGTDALTVELTKLDRYLASKLTRLR
jgi:DNA-binding MarR family transcriptional regulator